MVIFSHVNTNITVFQIEKIEQYVGLAFPQQYKEHLLKYNGGQCKPNVFEFITNTGKLDSSIINWFLAIYDGKYDNLKECIEIFKIEEKRMPRHILPIADDPGGNMICISTSGADEGYIYFWDHEQEVDYSVSDDSDYSNLFLIAKSFNEFLNGLKDSDFIDTLNN
jgi:cell wall assembly regulator SMI1